MTTLRGGGGNFLPGMVIIFCPSLAGGLGGASRITSGSGVSGRAGTWRMITGGACLVGMSGAWVMIRSPGGSGVGGLR